jgi:hypothetical protein
MGFISEVFIRSGKTRLMNRMTRGRMSWGEPRQRAYLYFAAVAILSASICAQTDTRQAEENFERWAKILDTRIQRERHACLQSPVLCDRRGPLRAGDASRL